METEALLQAVEKRTCLYNKEDPNYSNRNFINAEWKKVGSEVGCSDIDAKKRWKQLRDYFLKALREPQKSGSAGGVKKKWYLFDRMLFIKPYIIDRKTSSNMEPLSPEDTAGDDIGSQDNTPFLSTDPPRPQTSTPSDVPNDETEVLIDPELESDDRQPQRTNVAKRARRLFPQQRSSQSRFDIEMLEATKRLGNNKQKELSEEEHFCQSLVPKLKQLSPLDKVECQAEIYMLLLRYMRKGENRHDQNIHSQSYSSTNTATVLSVILLLICITISTIKAQYLKHHKLCPTMKASLKLNHSIDNNPNFKIKDTIFLVLP